MHKVIFQIVWALLSSVAFLLGGPSLPESYQVYAFASGIFDSIFKSRLSQVNLQLSEFYSTVERVFERNLLLQINDPLII